MVEAARRSRTVCSCPCAQSTIICRTSTASSVSPTVPPCEKRWAANERPPRTRGGQAMTPEQIALVQDSFQRVSARSDELAADFYRRLFIADPAARELFTTDMALQRIKFMRELE